jgi:hypothetical protein
MLLLVVCILAAVIISALCSMAEAALLSLTPSQLAEVLGRHRRAALIWQRFKRHIEKPISAILIVNTAAATIGATIAGAQFEHIYGRGGLIIFSIIFTYLILQFGEILPKVLGVRYNRRLAVLVARPLDVLTTLLSPISYLVRLLTLPFAIKDVQSPEAVAMREIMALASSARLSNLIDSRQERLIRAASHLPELCVRQIMTPRTEVLFLKVDDPLSEILQTIQQSAYTRLPLCENDMDHVIGVVHVKDLFKQLQLMVGRLRFADGQTPDGEAIGIVDGQPGPPQRHVRARADARAPAAAGVPGVPQAHGDRRRRVRPDAGHRHARGRDRGDGRRDRGRVRHPSRRRDPPRGRRLSHQRHLPHPRDATAIAAARVGRR